VNPAAGVRAATTVAKKAAVFVFLGALLAACVPAASKDRFEDWSATTEAVGVAEYRQYLQEQGLDDVAPMPALLRSARSWRECDAGEFALPPRALWPNILPTLRALRQLQAAGLVDGRKVASGYREGTLNRCAGGSARSRHLSNNALDFDLSESPDNVKRLCDFWRGQGPALKLGLGFYTDTRIHLDTSGFRTWGSDHTWRTSLCRPRAPAS
jgi:hypothetical protein